MKSSIVAIVAAFLLFGSLTPSARSADQATNVTVALSTDQPRYYVGELVRLELAIRNDSDRELSGFLDLMPPHEGTALFFRRSGQPFDRLDFSKRDSQTENLLDRIRIVRVPITIAPNSERRSAMYVITRPHSPQLVFDEPGVYELYLEHRSWSGRDETVLRSDTALVHVEAPPNQYREALSEYLAKGLPSLLRSWPFPPPLDQESAANAASFLEHHPKGPYSDKVREALVRGLRHRIERKRATADEAELYEKLKDSQGERQNNEPDDVARQAREIIERRQAERPRTHNQD